MVEDRYVREKRGREQYVRSGINEGVYVRMEWVVLGFGRSGWESLGRVNVNLGRRREPRVVRGSHALNRENAISREGTMRHIERSRGATQTRVKRPTTKQAG